MKTPLLFILYACFLLWGCDTNAEHPLFSVVLWGGTDMALDLRQMTGKAYFNGCREGTLDFPIQPDAQGRFSVTGTYTITAGPGRVRPAQYEGTIGAEAMHLTISLTDTGEKLPPFVLKPVQVLPFGPSACL